jgi:hypothetical protein
MRQSRIVGNKSRTGMTNSPEMRKHISESLMGTKCGLGNKSRTGQKRSPEEIAKQNATKRERGNLCHTEETKRKISETKKGKPHPHGSTGKGRKFSDETRRIMSEKRKGYQWSDESRSKLSKTKMGHTMSEECKGKLRKYWAEHKEEHRAIGRKAWENEEKRDKMVRSMFKARFMKPNKIETFILELLDEYYPYEWSYVGDGTLVIGGKCPDFSRNHGHNHLIEFYGDYWHKGENEQKRIDYFKKYGYETIIIWEKQVVGKTRQEIYELIDGKLKMLSVEGRHNIFDVI